MLARNSLITLYTFYNTDIQDIKLQHHPERVIIIALNIVIA